MLINLWEWEWWVGVGTGVGAYMCVTLPYIMYMVGGQMPVGPQRKTAEYNTDVQATHP